MKLIKNDRCIVDGLKNITTASTFDYTEKYQFPNHYGVTLIYSTDDLYLSEHQFNAIKSIIQPQETIFMAQNDENNPFIYDNCLLLQANGNMSYTDYRNSNQILYLYSTALMFSDTFDWILIIEETLEGGVGILAGTKEKINQFESAYSRTKQDLRDIVQFHIKDTIRNPQAIDNLNRYITLIK